MKSARLSRLAKLLLLPLVAIFSLLCASPDLAIAKRARSRSFSGGLQITEYYTMLNHSVKRSDCRGEGNQIVRGQLYGSDCRPLRKYCQWGVGAHNTCIRPCQDAAGGGAFHFNQVVPIPPRLCKWGPHKGEWITQVRIVDVGSAVRGRHVDLFQGLCKRLSGYGTCLEYEPDDTMVAQYGGQGRPQIQTARAGEPEEAGR